MEYRICKYCILERGIKGSELKEKHLETDEDLVNHIESEHHIRVLREGETEEKCEERFYKTYPEARDTKTCKCPECSLKRKMEESLFDIVKQN